MDGGSVRYSLQSSKEMDGSTLSIYVIVELPFV